MLYLCNGFSVHMFRDTKPGNIVIPIFESIPMIEAARLLQSQNFRSFFGHADTAPVLSSLLRVTINENRGLIKLQPEDELVIASLISKRQMEAGYDPAHWFLFWHVTFIYAKSEVKKCQ